MSHQREGRFRLRRPSREIYNAEIPAGKEKAAWQDLLEFVALVKADRLHSFRLQVNLKREASHGTGE